MLPLPLVLIRVGLSGLEAVEVNGQLTCVGAGVDRFGLALGNDVGQEDEDDDVQ